jgi:uncharacterized repeat protein (TIGR03943 family)
VSTETQAIPLVLAAALLLRLGLTDDHLLYVQPAMRPWLVTGGVVLVAITAGYVLARGTRRPVGPGRDEPPSGARDHHPGAIGWLLALPIAAVVVVPSEPLGAYAAARQRAQPPPAPASLESAYSPLPPPVDGVVEMTLGAFVSFALYDTGRQLEGKTVQITGFVTTPTGADAVGGADDGIRLTRFTLSCCAADARATSVALRGLPGPRPPDDTWLEVDGTWLPDPSGREPRVPSIEVTTVRQIPTPTDPYGP